MSTTKMACVVMVLVCIPAVMVSAQRLTELSPESAACIACHKQETPGICEQWGSSKHFRANVGCYECHQAGKGEPDTFEHMDAIISVIVSPKDCSRCHAKEAREFQESHHAKAGRILRSLDNVLAEVVEGDRGLVTPMFPEGVSAAAVSGCWQCHGAEVKVLPEDGLDPATWPNTGIGRINPDGSEGSCTACHSRHAFSAAQARNPENCGKCHMGPDHPQIEIYNESKHGIAFRANLDKMKLDNPKWVVGEDYDAAPTCSTCHMSATRKQPVTHDVGLRISWNNRPAVSIRPELSDAKMGLAGKEIAWEERRENMTDVCANCHNAAYVRNFYKQYDGLIQQYTDKFALPGQALMAAAKPLLQPAEFANKLDWTWFELWHHEGRRARHGASMMGPDYTHWHGTYEVAKCFYTELIPQLQELAKDALASKDPKKVEAAEALQKKIDETLNQNAHKWFLNKMDAEEVKTRQQRMEEFQRRYKK